MLVGGVIRDEVHYHANVAPMGFGNQPIEGGQVAVVGMNAAIVADDGLTGLFVPMFPKPRLRGLKRWQQIAT